jgi:transcriptional regulator with XRE-family HTH domain
MSIIRLKIAEVCGNMSIMAKDSKIKILRLKHRLSQNGLARKSELDRATVSAAENGKSVSDLTLSKIASVFGLEAVEIDERQ